MLICRTALLNVENPDFVEATQVVKFDSITMPITHYWQSLDQVQRSMTLQTFITHNGTVARIPDVPPADDILLMYRKRKNSDDSEKPSKKRRKDKQ